MRDLYRNHSGQGRHRCGDYLRRLAFHIEVLVRAMVTITPSIKKDYPEAFRIARREKYRVVWLEGDLIYVARRKRGHAKYLVKLFAAPSIDGGHQVKMACRSIDNKPCQGSQWKGFCSHMAIVILRSESKPESTRKDQAA